MDSTKKNSGDAGHVSPAKNKSQANEAEKTLSISLLDLQDRLNNVLFAMDFYCEAVDAIMSKQEPCSLPTERQKNGLSLFGTWIVDNIESIEQSVESLRMKIEKAEECAVDDVENNHIRESRAQYSLLGNCANMFH